MKNYVSAEGYDRALNVVLEAGGAFLCCILRINLVLQPVTLQLPG